MIARGRRLKSNTLVASAIALMSLLATPGCAEFSEWVSFESAEKADARARAEAASLWEMTLMAGRYGVMLDQAREILKLPEPSSPGGASFPTSDADDVGQRKALAAFQVSVAGEFFADAARACKRKRVPAGIRKMACAHGSGPPEELRKPAPLEIAALSARNDAIHKIVMPWWDAACALAPKPKGDDMPACAME